VKNSPSELVGEALPERGQIVRVRHRRYLVEDVAASKAGDSTLIRLSCVDDDAQGQSLDVLWEHEIDSQVLSGEAWEGLSKRGFDDPAVFAAYLNTLRWNRVTATDPNLFQSPFRAGIQLNPYQLEPLRKALALPRVNLFIADDVGVGKTIEAGLITRELLLRKKVRDIVVATPPSMLLQWKDELESRFGLSFEILDKAFVARLRRERGYGVNPWTTHTRFLVSHRLLIDETYAGPLRDWLGDFHPGSLLILDEAHNAAPSSGSKYAIDSKITRAVRDLSPRFEHRLFLSATPHNGHSNSFSALLEILDPQRFCRGISVRGRKDLEPVMVRRLKDDLREISGGFPKRIVEQVDIDGLPEDAPELVLARLLDKYGNLRAKNGESGSKRQRAISGLLISGLQQRLLSSIEAFHRTLKVHKATLVRMKTKDRPVNPEAIDPGQFDLLGAEPGPDDERSTAPEETTCAEQYRQVEMATAASVSTASSPISSEELALVEQMERLSDKARLLPDARMRKLVEWIRKNMCPAVALPDEPPPPQGTSNKWNDTRLLIFTEYEDTKRYVQQRLNSALEETDNPEERIAVYHGPTPLDKREEIKRAFNSSPKENPLRILIATDAAREGLNLQNHCHDLFHFDVPWNPGRMEQRNGRIDRKLQRSEEVHCRYFFYKQRPEDRILLALIRKTETIKKELGSLSAVIDDRLAGILEKGGIRRSDIPNLEKKISDESLDPRQRETAAIELEETRRRREEIKSDNRVLEQRLSDSKRWLGFEEDRFQDAISQSLRLMGAPGLAMGAGKKFDFPRLDLRAGGDPTWAQALDALRPPRKRDQTLWNWRKDAPVLPIVFEDSGTLDRDQVHLHLEHRLARRLLNRFTAQGFVHHDLSRACFAQAKDGTARVILLGRLCLYGRGASRLHEELVFVGAQWIDPKKRKGALKPYAETAERTTRELLDEALDPGARHSASPDILRMLAASAAQDVAELSAHLESVGQEKALDVEKKLVERGEKEARAMRDIVADQKKRIQTEVARRDKDIKQLTLDFGDSEKRQFEDEYRHLRKRLAAIDHEIDEEPKRIREVYRVMAKRVEPIGLVYLWPRDGSAADV